jgi:tetratricopeptide (TPR) repeat protein
MSATIAAGVPAMTSGFLALLNLQAQIDGREALHSAGYLSLEEKVELIELIALRGYLLGRVADYELAEDRADELCRYGENAAAYLARARSHARFHRFGEALDDLDRAERLGADGDSVDRERATIFQAQGEYDAALALFRLGLARKRDFASLGALAVFHCEREDCAAAEALFEEGRKAYHGVSPIPLAMLEFQIGHMWMSHGDPERARFWFQMAADHLPGCAPAAGHLAEVEAAFGQTARAIERLGALTESSDDPDYASALARIIIKAGRTDEAEAWRSKAAAGYDDLLNRHYDAFADHAAAFLLERGGDSHRALALAQRNLEIRRTPRSLNLYERARQACSDAARNAEGYNRA